MTKQEILERVQDILNQDGNVNVQDILHANTNGYPDVVKNMIFKYISG